MSNILAEIETIHSMSTSIIMCMKHVQQYTHMEPTCLSKSCMCVCVCVCVSVCAFVCESLFCTCSNIGACLTWTCLASWMSKYTSVCKIVDSNSTWQHMWWECALKHTYVVRVAWFWPHDGKRDRKLQDGELETTIGHSEDTKLRKETSPIQCKCSRMR